MIRYRTSISTLGNEKVIQLPYSAGGSGFAENRAGGGTHVFHILGLAATVVLCVLGLASAESEVMRPTARTTALEIPSKGGILASPAPIGTKLTYAEAGWDHVPSLMQEDDSETRAKVRLAYADLPLSFEANQGQTDARVRFLSRGRGYTLFFAPNEVALVLRKPHVAPERMSRRPRNRWRREPIGSHESEGVTRTVVRMKVIGANPAPRVVGLNELPGKVNYFIGNNPLDWRVDIQTYAKIKYEDVYSGVDFICYGNPRQLEYDFVVAPGADPNRITLSFEGANVSINNQGDLVLRIAGGEIKLQRPHVYQEVNGVKHIIPGSYRLLPRPTGHVAFQVAAYDTSKPLIIDPVLSYSTYLGGSSSDFARAIAVDAAGNAYVTGDTDSPTFPTANALQPALSGGIDAFVTKFNAVGNALVYPWMLPETPT